MGGHGLSAYEQNTQQSHRCAALGGGARLFDGVGPDPTLEQATEHFHGARRGALAGDSQSNCTAHRMPGAFARRASAVSNDVASVISANATYVAS